MWTGAQPPGHFWPDPAVLVLQTSSRSNAGDEKSRDSGSQRSIAQPRRARRSAQRIRGPRGQTPRPMLVADALRRRRDNARQRRRARGERSRLRPGPGAAGSRAVSRDLLDRPHHVVVSARGAAVASGDPAGQAGAGAGVGGRLATCSSGALPRGRPGVQGPEPRVLAAQSPVWSGP